VQTPGGSALDLFLRRVLLRTELTEQERAAILSLPYREATIEAGRDIVRPGEHTDHACLVHTGLVSRFDTLLDGRRQTVALYIPGDMCDLHSVPVPRTGWGMEALTTSKVAFVPHQALRALAHDLNLALAFWRDTAVDASILAKWVANLGRKSAPPRLAHLFCELGIKMEQSGVGTRTEFVLPMTQAQLADVVGLTTVHLNRTLKALAGEGVTFARKTVKIADWAALAEMAEFDPTYLLLPPDKAP
jgi:CRP-like cAMP-binding protein